jgi:hypothetical protein
MTAVQDAGCRPDRYDLTTLCKRDLRPLKSRTMLSGDLLPGDKLRWAGNSPHEPTRQDRGGCEEAIDLAKVEQVVP